jgi:hypothetical protein
MTPIPQYDIKQYFCRMSEANNSNVKAGDVFKAILVCFVLAVIVVFFVVK